MNYTILASELADLDKACALYEDAIAFQKRKGYPQYRWDDRAAQKEYIETGRHFKVMIADEIAGIFNVQTTDEKVWRERDQGDAIYLHGVLVHSSFKGLGLFKKILDWVADYARAKEKAFVRLDTWANNPKLENYYKALGFQLIEHFQIPNTEDTPLNCRGNEVVLMEYPV